MGRKRRKDREKKKPQQEEQRVTTPHPARQNIHIVHEEHAPSRMGPGANTGRESERDERGKARP